MAKLLLLDDEPETLEWMTAALTSLGHEVRAYLNGRAALNELTGWRPDLIVADLLMPELDGLTFSRLVRAQGGPPIVFISIAMKQADAILAGAVGYVQKPATADEIRWAVAHVLGHAKQHARILIVDDDPDARELFGQCLGRRFEVEEAEHGKAALAKLHQRSFDLVITDFHMPVMNGLELIRALRADPALERIPVIVQTSDRVALSSPVWRELKVAHQLDKVGFARWLQHRIDARLPASSETHAER
ncbi:MAG TPA: response regulator [Kofleriaceae bacterium]